MSIERRMHELGEPIEFLSDTEHAEYMAFVEFWRSRNLERLEASAALKHLHEVAPNLLAEP